MKRQRSSSSDAQRLVLDVGGTRFSTTVGTLERSAYAMGLVDTHAWDADPAHVPEIFIDRDPDLFRVLLRLMRQLPIVALPTHDMGLVASLLAEADFFGVDALLSAVKARAFYNLHEMEEDRPPDYLNEENRMAANAAGSAAAAAAAAAGTNPHEARSHARSQRWKKLSAAWHKDKNEIDSKFKSLDEEYGARRFDEVHGSMAEALTAGLLPKAYFEVKSKPAEQVPPKVVQLQPVQCTTWFLVGDALDAKCASEVLILITELLIIIRCALDAKCASEVFAVLRRGVPMVAGTCLDRYGPNRQNIMDSGPNEARAAATFT